MQKLKKTLVSLLVVAMISAFSAVLVGCSGNDQNGTSGADDFEIEDIQVINSGFTVTGDNQVNFAFVAMNPNMGHLANDVVFTIEGYDADGNLIVGGGQTLSMMYPESEVAAAGTLEIYSQDDNNAPLETLNITPMMDSISWEETTITGAALDEDYYIDRAIMNKQDDGSLDITANVGINEGVEDAAILASAYGVVVLENEEGEILCGSDPVIFTIDLDNQPYPFQTSILNAPEYTSCTLYVTPY